MFGSIATYGLRPHQLWHAEVIDSQGWISIPGDMKTRADDHFAPPIPEAWVVRYGLRQNWEPFHGQLNARWTVRFADVSGAKIAVNNVAVSNSLYKEFQRKGLQKLWAPVADGEGMDVHRQIYLRWLSSSRRKELLKRRIGGGVAVNLIQPFASGEASDVSTVLPEGITPELLEIALKLKAAGLG